MKFSGENKIWAIDENYISEIESNEIKVDEKTESALKRATSF